ncbi:class A beta-lactamase-related serine hydrolase [Micromonospora sp. CPCC 205371]|nr:class A beta-lactamase-related serine hydrolase [Micromonospora sp. CPCC 205371]
MPLIAGGAPPSGPQRPHRAVGAVRPVRAVRAVRAGAAAASAGIAENEAVDWGALDKDLDSVPGTVSVCTRPFGGPPTYTRLPDATHYAASTMKAAVLAALYRSDVDLEADVPVHNVFPSAASGSYGCTREYDSDPEVWERLGGTASLRWLATRMIVKSSNLATNIVLGHTSLPAVAKVWDLVGARHSVTTRGIEDALARKAGIENLVTAADLAALLTAIATGAAQDAAGHPALASTIPARPDVPNLFDSRRGATNTPNAVDSPHGAANMADALDLSRRAATTPGAAGSPRGGAGGLASPGACRAMLDVLLAQERREDLAAGLPPGTRIAHKNGWVPGVRHSAGVVFPDDAPPYAIAVCATTSLSDEVACALLARISADAWAARHA